MNTRFHGTLSRHLIRPALIAGMLVTAGSGCVFYEGKSETCSNEARPGLLVSVVDFETGAPIPATIQVIDGAYREELGPANLSGSEYAAAYERAGVYRIEVSSEGYFPENRADVVVADGACHVVTEEVLVQLISEESGGCTDEAVPGLVITVVDAVSGLPVTATVKVSDGAYVEELGQPSTEDEYWIAYERAGVYDIEVSSDGHVPVTIQGVEVMENSCHVITEKLEVSLERA
jgi:hypothetical protein